MARLQILEYPDPRLRTKAKPVEVFDAALAKQVEDMFETMYAAPGIGLAATQWTSTAMIVMDVSEGRSEPHGLQQPRDPDARRRGITEEGCCPFPGFTMT